MPAKGQRSGYTFNCENCGEEVYQTKTQYERAEHHFCSNKCQKQYQHNQLFEDRKCEICNNTFHVSKKSAQRFCSIECQNKWQTTRVGENNPQTNRIKCNCTNCKKLIKIKPSRYERYKNHFCNKKCKQEWFLNVLYKTKEWKEKSRIRAAKILKDNKNTLNTKPQIMINQLLEEMNISYRNEEVFEYYSVDNYLYDNNLIIEVMGDFWHSNPIKYSLDNLKEIQKQRIPKDKTKHTYIKKYYNIEILYLWEKDIYDNIDLCKNLILEYIANDGILKNYHSFNYTNQNNILTLNKNIIYPLFDNMTNA